MPRAAGNSLVAFGIPIYGVDTSQWQKPFPLRIETLIVFKDQVDELCSVDESEIVAGSFDVERIV